MFWTSISKPFFNQDRKQNTMAKLAYHRLLNTKISLQHSFELTVLQVPLPEQ